MLVAKLTAVLNEESGVTAPSFCGFSGSHCLQALQQVEDDEADHAEQQHGEGVSLPVHLLLGPHAAEAIDQPLDRAQDAVEAEQRLPS